VALDNAPAGNRTNVREHAHSIGEGAHFSQKIEKCLSPRLLTVSKIATTHKEHGSSLPVARQGGYVTTPTPKDDCGTLAAVSARECPSNEQSAAQTGPGMTIDQLLEWAWLFDDEEFWEAISESRGGRGICTRRSR
jgi:hypothetical protein